MTATALRAKVVLAEMEAMGITIEDLIALGQPTAVSKVPIPSVAAYVEVVRDSYEARSRRTYNSYWRLMVEQIGEKLLTSVTVDDLVGVADEAVRRAKRRRTGSNGRASRESCVGAMRAVFTRAHKTGLVPTNLGLLVDKPRRLGNRRRALNQNELDDVWAAVTATTKDPELDLLLVRFHLETGARRMGAIKLRVRDLDHDRQTIWLREKFGEEREQPLSRTLLNAVADLGARRGAHRPDDPVLRLLHYRQGQHTPISDRTYDRIFANAQAKVPWSTRTPLTAHMLRHTAVTAIERLAGGAVAQAFAGHNPSSVTGIYTKADIGEVAAAVAQLTGEPHPLAVGL